jgi:phage protein D
MSDSNTIPSYYSPLPTLSIDGQENSSLSEGLLELSVEETTAGLYSCEATFGNWGGVGNSTDFLYFDRQVLDFGKTLTVTAGQADGKATIFTGRITALEGKFPASRPPEITVLAEDRFQDLRMARRTCTYENVSDADVIRKIAARNSLQPQIDVDGPTYTALAQINLSDLAFLRERARAVDAEAWVQDTTLNVQARSRRKGASVSITYGKQLREFTIAADLAHQRTSLIVSGWDVSAKQGLSYEAQPTAIQSELGGLLGGSALLQSALGNRTERIVHLTPRTQQEAQSLAESAYRMLARRFLTGQGVTEGDGRIRVGAQLTLDGLGPLFNGVYYVCETRHVYDSANGFRTHFRVESPGLGTGAG